MSALSGCLEAGSGFRLSEAGRITVLGLGGEGVVPLRPPAQPPEPSLRCDPRKAQGVASWMVRAVPKHASKPSFPALGWEVARLCLI